MLPVIDAGFDHNDYKLSTNCEAYEIPPVYIASVAFPNGSHCCGWAMRSILHCHLLGIKFIAYRIPMDSIENLSDEIKQYWVYGKQPPFIWVNKEYVGGYYDLLERFPVL